MYVIRQSQLPFAGTYHEFVGLDHGSVGISFFVVIGKPRQGTRLHKHDYDEVVYVIAGRSQWTAGDERREAAAGDVLIVRAGEPHKFINSGHGSLRQLDIHLNPAFETTWLED